jgi:zinc and cadmium transporter
MNGVLFFSFVSVLAVCLVSLTGISILLMRQEMLKRVLLFFVSLSAGALLGDAFIHLLPEAVEEGGFTLRVSLPIIASIIVFFLLEKFISWRHCHEPTSEEHPHTFGLMNMAGDLVHNFIDGMVIAGSFFASIPLGIQTTIAVVAHEIPQEMGDFGVLLYAGYSARRAVLYNFLTALSAFAGMGVTLYIGMKAHYFSTFIVPFAAGGFIYVACSDLIPELHKETAVTKSLAQLGGFLSGIALMVALILLE